MLPLASRYLLLAPLLAGCFHQLDRQRPPALDAVAPADSVPPRDVCARGVLLHVTFDGGKVVDRVGDEQPQVQSALLFDPDGPLGPSLKRTTLDNGLEYRIANYADAEGTVALWVRPEGDPSKVAGETRFLMDVHFKEGFMRLVHWSQGSGVGVWNVGPSGVYCFTVAPINVLRASTWVHLAFSYRRASRQVELFLDGASMKSAVLSEECYPASAVPGRLLIGGSTVYYSGGSPDLNTLTFPGLYDSVMMFDRRLSPAEVKELHDSPCL
jgi:hypothetical protein